MLVGSLATGPAVVSGYRARGQGLQGRAQSLLKPKYCTYLPWQKARPLSNRTTIISRMHQYHMSGRQTAP